MRPLRPTRPLLRRPPLGPCFLALLLGSLQTAAAAPASPPAAAPRSVEEAPAVAASPLVPAAGAPAAAARTPEDVTRRTLEAMRGRNFKELAEQAHPAALADLRQKLRPLVAADATHELGKLFLGVETLEQFDALNDRALFAALMTKMTALGNETATAAPSDARFTILGSVLEPPDLAHVVYRAAFTLDSGPASTVNVMTLQKDHGAWKSVLSDNLEDVMAGLYAMLEASTVKE